jgi:hypothetical protein
MAREGGHGFFLIYMSKGDGRGRGLIFLLLSGRGWRLMFYFLLHLTCARRRGSELVFFVNFFFHY